MHICYSLSNRQAKTLLIRHTPIDLLLPVPPIEVDDWLDWARSILPADLRGMVTEADEPEEYRVRPRLVMPRDLTDLIGEIADTGWTIAVVAVRVRLTPPRVAHQASGVPQWPGGVMIDGRPLIRTEAQ